MKQQYNTVSSIIILGLLLCFGLYYRNPDPVNSVIKRVFPKWNVEYTGEELSYADDFNDINARQLAAARKIGLKEVPATRDDIDYDQLTRIRTCNNFRIAGLTHSVPYLVPGAAEELDEIGRAFREKLDESGLPEYHIVVTSVLRSKEDVTRLMKTNKNATSNSAHCYGTTFDIGWNNFDKAGIDIRGIDNEELKAVLGAVLKEERAKGRIYVKYEANQKCFHITFRG